MRNLGTSLTGRTETMTDAEAVASPSEATMVSSSVPCQSAAGTMVATPVSWSMVTVRKSGSSARDHVSGSPSASTKAEARSSDVSPSSSMVTPSKGTGRRGGELRIVIWAVAGGPSSRPSQARTSTVQTSPLVVWPARRLDAVACSSGTPSRSHL